MESVVNKIIEIDRMADIKISDAKKQSDEILSNAEMECVKLASDISSAAEKRIFEIEKINRFDYDSRVALLEEKYGFEKSSMDNVFEKTHVEIENAIFSEIVGECFESV